MLEEGESLIAYVPDPKGGGDSRLRQALAGADPHAQSTFHFVPDADWDHRWREGVRSHAVGTLTIVPPWLAEGLDLERVVVIDPGLGFGTGEHESTRGALRLLSRVVHPGDVVADLGTGSGVLAIAAAKLGASRVAAIEIDEMALGNAVENVARNGVADRVHAIGGDAHLLLPLLAPVRVIVANIISSVLTELLPTMARALAADGRVILGGILLDERAAMTHVLADGGWRVDHEDIEGTWWSAVAARR